MLEIVMRWHKDKKTYEKVCCISMLWIQYGGKTKDDFINDETFHYW
jgi:hypothetical protein